MRQNKVREPKQPIADDIAPKRRRGTKPRRAVAIGDVVIPKKGRWAREECLVLEVEKRPWPSGYYLIVHVLLPNQRQRCYPLMEIKEIIPGKGAILKKPHQRKSDVKAPNKKLNMEVVMKHVSGTAEANLERAKDEVNRVLSFRGSVTGVKAEGTRITVQFEINPKWDLPMSAKVECLKEWIPAKVRTIFKVHDIALRDNQRHKGQ